MNRLIKEVLDATDVTTKEMNKSAQEGFMEVQTKLDSLYDVVLKRAPESAIMQDFASINIEPRVRNVQIPPSAIDA